jgi:hypothetical protein
MNERSGNLSGHGWGDASGSGEGDGEGAGYSRGVGYAVNYLGVSCSERGFGQSNGQGAGEVPDLCEGSGSGRGDISGRGFCAQLKELVYAIQFGRVSRTEFYSHDWYSFTLEEAELDCAMMVLSEQDCDDS